MRRLAVSLAMLAVAAITPAGAFGGDHEIFNQIRQQLEQHKASGQLKNFTVGVHVKQGQVWLNGNTASMDQKQRVLAIVGQTPGVTNVHETIAVGDSARRQPASGNALRQPSSVAQRPQPVAQPHRPQAAPASYNAPRQAGTRSVLRAPQQQMPRQYAPVRTAQVMQPGMIAQPQPIPMGQPIGQAFPSPAEMGVPGPPVPMYQPGPGGPMAATRYDHPRMPGYAWPSYAAYPNYAALTYPKQYAPTAWPYIGPFYPYPQVPLGWRKVTLEWDDGWWFLDFKSK